MAAGAAHALGWPFWALFAAFGLGIPAGAYVAACFRCKGLASLARYRMAFYDLTLHYAVRYARQAIAIDENRKKFACVPWDAQDTRESSAPPSGPVPARIKQVWFAGSHSDVGGSYPETESRLSDIALAWMVQEARSLPSPILIDHSVLRLYPDSGGPQHDERAAFIAACPRWLVWCSLWFVKEKNFGWREGHRQVPHDAVLHPSVIERFRRPAVLKHGRLAPYRPQALRRHPQVAGFYGRHPAAAGFEDLYEDATSSVTTLKPMSFAGPKLVESATSVASRPRAMSTRPMRGLLWRASKVYQRPSR